MMGVFAIEVIAIKPINQRGKGRFNLGIALPGRDGPLAFHMPNTD